VRGQLPVLPLGAPSRGELGLPEAVVLFVGRAIADVCVIRGGRFEKEFDGVQDVFELQVWFRSDFPILSWLALGRMPHVRKADG